MTVAQYKTLERIRKRGGFKSLYELVGYLVYCFLRVADANEDLVDEPVPTDISEMFQGYSESETREWIKPKRRRRRSVNDAK